MTMMTLPKKFPIELLNKLPEARLAYFKDRRINHPFLEQKLEEVMEAIQMAVPQTIIFVFGPSHVGKSKLSTILKEKLAEQLNKEVGSVEEEPVLVEVVPPQTNSSLWKDFYVRVLTEMNEILIDKKVLYGKDRIISSGLGRTSSAPHLRIAVENCLLNRKPKAMLLDEAQHFTKISQSKTVTDQTDNLKSLVNKTAVPIVMFGTYDLLEMRDLSDQLISRGVDVHFPRYHYENELERAAFKNLLLSYEQHLPLREHSNLIEHFEFCYERTIGCAGALHKLLYRSLSYALYDEKHKEVISKKHLAQAALSAPKAKKLLEFANRGEQQLAKEKLEASGDILRNQLGMNLDKDNANLDRKEKNKQFNQRPGVRNPKRDKTGTDLESDDRG